MTRLDDMILRYRGVIYDVSTTVQTLLIDLDLPKGYGARIRHLEWRFEKLHEEAIGADGVHEIQAALVNDPDDIASTAIPANTIEHDVIDDVHEFFETIAGVELTQPTIMKTRRFTEDEDVFAVRNLRLNAFSLSGNTVVDIACIVDYTLEAVKDSELLKILRIT